MAEGRAGALEDYATVAFSMSGVKQDISLEDWKGGWASIVGGLNGKPTSQQFNMVTYILSALLNQAISDLSTVKRTANSAMPKSDFTAKQIVSLLGGRAAEQLMLGDISTGASNDIQQATNIARDMVMKYGMSEKLGPISFDDSSHSIFIGRDFGTTKSYSEETAATIDEEVKHLFDQAYAKCEALLREHADLLTGLAEYLLIHETIEGDDFRYYCEHGVMPVHPDDTIEPPAKVIRRMDEAPETPQPDAEAPAQPEAPSAPDADAPNSDPGEQL